MTKQETIKVITLIVASYPASERLKDKETITNMVSVWAQFFADDNYDTVMIAVQQHISVSKWPPSIAEIRAIMVSLLRPDIIPPDVAWRAVNSLLAVYDKWNDSGLSKNLPKIIADVVDTIGWDKLYRLSLSAYHGGTDGLDKIAFMEIYKPIYKRETEKAMLPKAVALAVQPSAQLQDDLIENTQKIRNDKQENFNRLMRLENGKYV